MTAPRASTDTALRAGIALLTLGTALIHLQLNFPDPVFILNGLGYLTLLAALYLPQLARYRNVVRWVLIGYAALTIFLWILIGARTPVGYIDKAIEIALITLLLVEVRRARR
jgi:membrane-bound ClpP family serine protease